MPSDDKDFNIMLNILVKESVFNKKPGRCHKKFPNISPDPFLSLNSDPKKLHDWLKHRKQIEATEQDLSMNLL